MEGGLTTRTPPPIANLAFGTLPSSALITNYARSLGHRTCFLLCLEGDYLPLRKGHPEYILCRRGCKMTLLLP